jgi:hypothetical protein
MVFYASYKTMQPSYMKTNTISHKKNSRKFHHFSHIHESYKIMRTLALNMPSMQNEKQD